ncbi:MAG: RecX family transcriptional regulator [Bacteroidetes bacterium]|nr:RecX family transcriptional regulator [Bacteroidota bacterium]
MDEIKRTTKEVALSKLMDTCSKREICESKAIEFLWRWKVNVEHHNEILESLISNKFIDNERYARLYVKGKKNLSSWGKGKIKENLSIKRIDKEIIKNVLEEEYSNEENIENLKKALSKKMKSTKYKDEYDLRNKLVRFGISRGFEYENVLSEIKNMINLEEF